MEITVKDNGKIESKRRYSSRKSMGKTMNPVRTLRLKKDIVIPAGTILSQAPKKIDAIVTRR